MCFCIYVGLMYLGCELLSLLRRLSVVVVFVSNELRPVVVVSFESAHNVNTYSNCIPFKDC